MIASHFPSGLTVGAAGEVVRIVRQWFGATDTVFGVAFLDQDGRGKSSDVFWDRCEGRHRDTGVNAATLQGTVAAHELGHLLLGSNAHSAIGIMSPHWENSKSCGTPVWDLYCLRVSSQSA